MAVRIVSNSGGTWTTTTTWVGGVVPVAGDTIEFTPTSGPLTINSAVICAGINFTNYLNTITFTNDLIIQGPINLGSGGYTQAGSNGLLVNSNAGGTGFTSNGVTWTVKFTLGGGGTAATYTFLDDWNFTGNLLMSNTNTMTLNSPGNIKTSNLTKTSTSVVIGSSNIIFNGNGTWSHTAAGYIQNNVIIDNPSNLTIGTNIYYQNGILTYSGGTVTTTGSTLTIGGSTTLNTNGMIWNNVTLNVGVINLTLTNDFNVSGNFSATGIGGSLGISFSGGGQFLPTGNFIVNNAAASGVAQITINLPNDISVISFTHNDNSNINSRRDVIINGNKNILVSGNIYFGNTYSSLLTGNSVIVANGSGTFIVTGGAVYTIPITINGNYSLNGSPTFTNSRITYLSGTITGATAVFVTSTLDLNSGGQWGTNVDIRGNTTLLSDATFGNLTTSTTAVSFSGTSVINIKGNLTINTTTSGTNVPININGTGNQLWVYGAAVNLSNNLTINKPSGNLTIGSISLPNIYYTTGTLSYMPSGGTVDTTLTTLNIGGTTTLSTSGITWANITTDYSTSSASVTLLNDLSFTNTLKLGATVNRILNIINSGGTITCPTTANVEIGSNINPVPSSVDPCGTGFNSYAGDMVVNFPASTTFNITNLTIKSNGQRTYFTGFMNPGFPQNTSINNGIFNVSGNLSILSSHCGGNPINYTRFFGSNSSIILKGSGNVSYNFAGSSNHRFELPITIDSTGNYNFTGTSIVLWSTNLNYISGTTSGIPLILNACTLNFSNPSLKWNTPVVFRGDTTLQSDVRFSNSVTMNTTAVRFSGGYNINIENNLSIDIATSNLSGNNTIVFNGPTGQTWSTSNYLSNSVTIDNSGNTLTLGQNIYYNTGTLKYVSGVVDWNTNNTTLNINSATSFDTNTLDLKNVSITGSIAYDITLNSEMNIVGLLKVLGTSTNRIRIKSNSSGVKRLLTLKPTATQNIKYTNALDIDSSLGYTVYSYRGNSILNTDNWQITNDLYFIGFTNSNYSNTNSWSTYSGGVPAEIIPDSTTNVIFDSNSSVNCIVDVASVAGTLNFLTYPSNRNITFNTNLTCSGNVTLGQNTESSNGTGNLVVNTSSVLTSNGYNFSAPMTLNGTSATYGFNGEWTSTSAVTFSNNITLSGSNLNISGGLLVNAAITVSGSKIILKNGTWSHTAAGYITNNIDIVPEVGNTLSLGANLYYRTGTINYINSGGTINAGSSILNINSNCSLNTSGMTWNRIDILSSSVLTLLSDLNSTTFYASYATNFSGPTRVVNVTNFYAGNNITTYASGSIITITIGNVLNTANITYYSNLSSAYGIYQGTIINGGVLNVTGNITLTPNASHAGNVPINWYPTNGSTLLNQGSYLRCDLNIYGTTNTAYISGSLYFDTKTLTYYSGNIITTGSTLYMYTGTANGYVSGPTQLNTSGMTWNNVVFGDQGGNTINLLSPITITGTTTLSSNSTLTVNGSDIIVKGNLTFTGGGNQRGNSKIYLTGSGTWTHPGGGYIINNVYIDTSGSYTISGNIRIGNTIGTTTSLIYINGSIDALNATLTIPPINGLSSLTLDTSTIIWGGLNCSYVSANSYEILNLLSHLNVFDITMSSSLSFTGVGILSVFRDIFIGRTGLTYNDGSTPTLTLPNNLMIRNLTLYGNGTYIFGNVPYGTAINNNTLTITGNITMSTTQFANTVHSGTSNIVWKTDGGTISQINSSFFHYNLTIDSPGVVNFSGTILYGGSKTLNYTRGKVNSKDATFYLTGGCTLLNLNKLIFNNVTITSGSNIVMNEFFSGNLNKVTTISPSSTTNYTITFQDGFEKFTKFVKISRATISRISQLTVVTNGGNNGNNIGIKFYPNQLSSGLPKNTPSIPLESNYGVNGLLVDPSLDLQ